MKRSRFTEEQIIGVLREQEALLKEPDRTGDAMAGTLADVRASADALVASISTRAAHSDGGLTGTEAAVLGALVATRTAGLLGTWQNIAAAVEASAASLVYAGHGVHLLQEATPGAVDHLDADRRQFRAPLSLYTATPGADGTLGGLAARAGRIGPLVRRAVELAALCSNDSICANHTPNEAHGDRPLHGAACHGCVFVAETSCEQRNDLLDRGLVVDTMERARTGFFSGSGVD
jgi:hypothetical protein